MNHTQRCEIIDRLEQQHEELIDQLDELNQQIEQALAVRPSVEDEA